MNKAEREQLIDRLRAEVAASTLELAQRKHLRELNGDFDELPTKKLRHEAIIHKTTISQNQQGLEFILSDATVDRMGDVIELAGWNLTHFNKNPVALFSHDPLFIVGKWANVGLRQNSLRGHLHLAPLGTSERIDEIIRLVESNVLAAVSVGFRPIESEPLPSGGLRFKKAELVECSLVSTPANPNALAVARSLHVSDATLRMVFDGSARTDEPLTPIEALADEIGIITGRMERELRAEIATLREEIGASRAKQQALLDVKKRVSGHAVS